MQGKPHGAQCVVDGDRCVRVRAGVQHEAGEALGGRGADPVDDCPFVVRLTRVDVGSELLAAGCHSRVDLGQRLPPVDVRLARSEEMQIRAGDAEKAQADGGCASHASVTRARR